MEKKEENVNDKSKAVLKKTRNIKRIMKTLPPKPKKAGTGFGAYLKEYWAKLSPEEKKRGVIKEAAAHWKNLSTTERAKFNEVVAEDKIRYTKAMETWKMAKRFNTRPASVYALYLKDLWAKMKQDSRITGMKMQKSIGEMGSQAAKQWAALTHEQKAPYVERFQRCQRRFVVSQRALKRGLDVDLNRELDVDEEYVIPEPEQEDHEFDEMDEFDEEEDDDDMEVM